MSEREQLEKVLRTGRAALRRYALERMSSIGIYPDLALIKELCNDPDAQVRSLAARAMMVVTRRRTLPGEAPQEEVVEEEVPQPLAGLTFVITGTLPSMSRDQAKALIERHGGKVTGSVSGRTDYLLVGEAPGATKYNKARELGVPMIEEAELVGMIERAREHGSTESMESWKLRDSVPSVIP